MFGPRTVAYCSRRDSGHIGGVRDIGSLEAHTKKSGSAVSDAGAIPMLWRWFPFVWFTGIGVTGGGGGRKNVAGCSPTLRSQCQGEVISLMVAGVLLGLRAAAALCCLLHAAIVPHPRVCALICRSLNHLHN